MTSSFASPEQLEKQDPNEKFDSWSAGIVFFMMCSNNEHPFTVLEKPDLELLNIFRNTKVEYHPKWFSGRGLPNEVLDII